MMTRTLKIDKTKMFSYPEFILITPWFGTFAGGGGRAIASLAEKLQQCGYPVTVLTTCSRSPYEDWRNSCYPAGEIQVNGIRTRRFPIDQSDPGLYHAAVAARRRGEKVSLELQHAFFQNGLNSQELIKYINQLDKNAILIAGTYFQSLVPSAINAHPGRIIALPAFHDEPEFYWAPIAKMVSNSRKLLFLSEEEKDLAIRSYGYKIGPSLIESPVIGLGVELDSKSAALLNDPVYLQQLRIRFSLPEHYLIYIGRIELDKGLSYLIPWMTHFNEARAIQGVHPIPLVLVGEGPPGIVPKSPWLMELGYLSESEKYAVINQSIGLINPSKLESFSYVVMEGWLAGAPILVPHDCAVTAGHVERCSGGLVYHNEREFLAHAQRLLDREFRTILAKRGQHYVRSRYRWPDVMDRILRATLA